jgi:hypothetical protein
MIGVQVGAHHQIDLVGVCTGGSQPVQPGRIQHVVVLVRRKWARFAVADARIDQ